MAYQKAAFSLDALVEHLRGKVGLEGDAAVIRQRIQDVGYYRLSPYWRCYREQPLELGSRLRGGTTIEAVWDLYTFDRELRLLILDAIERVEVGVRSRLVQHLVEAVGPFGYEDLQVTQSNDKKRYVLLLAGIRSEFEEAKDAVAEQKAAGWSEAILHFVTCYGDAHTVPPLWLAAESFSFGDLTALYSASPPAQRKAVATDFGLISHGVFGSWLLGLHTLRNVCAHHGRVWNTTFGTTVREASDPVWKEPVLGPRNRVFYLLTLLAHFLGILGDGSAWAHRFRALIEDRYPNVPREPMGMREGWAEHAVWRERLAPPR